MPRKRRKKSPTPVALPLLWAQLTAASMETIAHRSQMMASGRCSPAEYQRMVAEKVKAAQQMGFAALSPAATAASLLAPWHRAAQRNSKRLRRKR